jgi:Rap1a immunity proteins
MSNCVVASDGRQQCDEGEGERGADALHRGQEFITPSEIGVAGNDLSHASVEQKDIGREPRSYCAGYVAAMSDALVATGHACMPVDVTVQQAVDVVMKYLRDHPEQRQYSAWYLGRTALNLRLPCN